VAGFASLFDPICYSHEFGVAKPHPAVYEKALASMDAATADVLFIDDHQIAVDGAASVGIQGFLHRDNASTIAAMGRFLDD
jgi:putative hydrolase of the HAD superfamily